MTAVDERYVSGGIHGEPSAAKVVGIADLPPTGMTLLTRVFMPDGSKTDLGIRQADRLTIRQGQPTDNRHRLTVGAHGAGENRSVTSVPDASNAGVAMTTDAFT